jgi:hypothetical protein
MASMSKALTALANASERLITLSRLLRSRPDVQRVEHFCDLRQLASGPYLGLCVEVDDATGRGLSWCLDAEWTAESWQIESKLYLARPDGAETLEEFPLRAGTTPDAFVADLDRAVDLIIASAERFDFANTR